MLYQSTYYSHVANLLCSIKLKIAYDFLLHCNMTDVCMWTSSECDCRSEKLLFKIEKNLSIAADEGWPRRMCLQAYVQSSCIII